MIVYVDIVFIYNIIINYFFLFLIEKLFNSKINNKRLIVASICGAAMIFCYLLSNTVYKLTQIVGGAILIFIISKNKKRNKLIAQIFAFYLINFAFTGVLNTFRINTLVPTIAILGLISVFVVIVSYTKEYNIKTYTIKLELEKTTYEIEAFYDSGNFSLTSNNTPIIFINEKYKEPNLVEIEVVNIKTVIGEKLIPCYQPKKFSLIVDKKNIEVDVAICFVAMEKECILNRQIFMEEDIICQEV